MFEMINVKIHFRKYFADMTRVLLSTIDRKMLTAGATETDLEMRKAS